MRKPFIINIFVFLFAVSLGCGVCWLLSIGAIEPASAVCLLHGAPITQTTPENSEAETTKRAASKLRPCGADDDYRPEKNWRGSGTIRGGILNDRIRCGVLPEFPRTTHGLTESGRIEVTVLVDYDGRVLSADTRKGLPIFTSAAIMAASRTRFSPIMLGGQSYKVKGILIYEFDSRNGVDLQKTPPTPRHYKLISRD